MIKKTVRRAFKKLGFQIQRIPSHLRQSEHGINKSFTMGGALERCLNRGLNIRTVIDVGASDGRWSRNCMKYMPNAKYFLIEAQQPHEKDLKKFSGTNSNVDYILAAAGKSEGMIYFDNSSLLGGVASEKPFENNCIEVPVISIDGEVHKRKLDAPYLIKLDTHGFEVPILEGAAETLKNAELVVIECYNYQLTAESLLYYQMCEYMAKLGFSSIEIVDLTLRKHDHSFWQMDIFFIRSNRDEFSVNSYE